MKKIVLSMILALSMTSVAMASEVSEETSAPIEVKETGNDCDKYKDTKGYKPAYCEDENQTQEPVKEGSYKHFNEEK